MINVISQNQEFSVIITDIYVLSLIFDKKTKIFHTKYHSKLIHPENYEVMMHRIIENLSIRSMLQFIFPSIVMMIFLSLYTMVDGVFVANFVNEDALAAVNIVFPFISVVIAAGVMLSTGGNAVIAKNLGEGNSQKARQNLTLIFIVGIGAGIIIALIGILFTDFIINFLGATEKLSYYAYNYLKMLVLFSPFCILQSFTQSFLITAGKPKLGLLSIILAGLVNIILDYIFIVLFKMGIAGAALATGISYMISGIIGIGYFSQSKYSPLRFTKPEWDKDFLFQACFNGSSEMVTNLSSGIITVIFNIMMLRFLGESGVAAITVILYTQFLLIAIYLGFSLGISPVFSYAYGNKNSDKIKQIFKFSIYFIIISSIIIYGLSVAFSSQLLSIFLKKDSATFEIAQNGFYLFSLSFIFTGLNIFTSALFTAFSNGKISAILSFLRTFVFILSILILLPRILGVSGIWLAIPIAEFLTLIISIKYMKKYQKIYNY